MPAPIVVTSDALASAFNESVIESAPEKLEDLGDPVTRAAFLAALPAALQAVSAEARTVHQGLLFAPQHELASRLMSAVADQAPAESALEPLVAGGLELKFATNDWWGWFRSVFSWVSKRRFHPILRPEGFEPTPIPGSCRIGVLGDWGTGLYGAPVIASTVRSLPRFDVMLHLGDVYYSGTEKEVDQRFLAGWPFDAARLHRAINSNHEMYSGGHAYFGQTLPRFGQPSSYFALANDHWLILGLDTGYVDHDVDPEQVIWIGEMLDRAEHRRVVFLSHHQPFSHFEQKAAPLVSTLNSCLSCGRVAAWYWGHEHRCLIYEKAPHFGGLLARCIGHSGVPERRTQYAPLPIERKVREAAWRRFPGGNLAPAGLALDGENQWIKGNEREYSPHGFAVLELDGPSLSESVHLPDGLVIHQAELF